MLTAILPYFPHQGFFHFLKIYDSDTEFFSFTPNFILNFHSNFCSKLYSRSLTYCKDNTEFLYTPLLASSISYFIQIASVFPHVLSLFQNPILFLFHLGFSWLWQLLSFPVFKTLSFDYWLDSLQYPSTVMSNVFLTLTQDLCVLRGRPQRQSLIFITSNQGYILWEHDLSVDKDLDQKLSVWQVFVTVKWPSLPSWLYCTLWNKVTLCSLNCIK